MCRGGDQPGPLTSDAADFAEQMPGMPQVFKHSADVDDIDSPVGKEAESAIIVEVQLQETITQIRCGVIGDVAAEVGKARC